MASPARRDVGAGVGAPRGAPSTPGTAAAGAAGTPAASGARTSGSAAAAAGPVASAEDIILKQLTEDASGDEEGDPDFQQEAKALEELSKRLTQGDFGLEGSDDEDDDEEGDEEFEQSLMAEFRSMLQVDVKASEVPKPKLKELYLQLLARGEGILRDKGAAESFLSKLSTAEMAALMDLMAKDQEGIIRFFEGDAQIMEALRSSSTVSLAALAGERKGRKTTWDLDEMDDEEDDDEDDAVIAAKRAAASPALKKALETFEGNVSHYAQNPEELLKLSSTLPTIKEQNDFLDILFAEYTPEKIQQRLGQGAAAAAGPTTIEDLTQVMNPDLVAFVFKEVFSKFRIYKRAPEKFDPLVNRMNPLEKQAFDSLVRAFWDVSPDQLKL